MSNINLSVENKKDFNGEIFKSAQAIVVGVLLLVLIVYGVFILLVALTDRNIAQTEIAYSAEKQKLIGVGSENSEALDLQKRIVLAKSLIEKKSTPENVFKGLEESVIDGVSLTSVEYSSGDSDIAIEGNANNLYDLAKQLLSFKNSNIFGGIEKDISTSVSENSGIDFSFSLKINNSKI